MDDLAERRASREPVATGSEGPEPAVEPRPGEITDLLLAWREGSENARNDLIERLYPRLRTLAFQQLARRGDRSLQVTELVHALYVELVGSELPDWKNRAHFLAISSILMREILVDRARRRAADKRGGGLTIVSLEATELQVAESQPDVLAVHDALTKLAETNPSAARVVELRLFGGLTHDESASVLGIGTATSVRRWRFARAWLRRALG